MTIRFLENLILRRQKKSQYLPERQQQDSHNLCCYAKTTQAVVAEKRTMT
jgi:hypothetical protein